MKEVGVSLRREVVPDECSYYFLPINRNVSHLIYLIYVSSEWWLKCGVASHLASIREILSEVVSSYFIFNFYCCLFGLFLILKRLSNIKKSFSREVGYKKNFNWGGPTHQAGEGGGELLLKRGGGNFRGSRNLYRNYEVNVCWDIQHINLAL